MTPELKPVPNNDSSFGRGAQTWETAQPVASDAQKVLRNTYLLLALSMVPTVLGAVIGVQMNFSFFAGSPFIGFMVFLGIAFGFFYGIEKTKNSPMGVVLLLAFTFFMGLMLSRLLVPILGLKSTVHFRADFQPIAETILVVQSPGAHITDPVEMPYKHLRKGIKLSPMGPVWNGRPV